MVTYAIAPPERTVLPIHGDTAVFPVNRVFCVGRNYAAHAREMGGVPERQPPFFFMKPGDAVVPVPEGTVGVFRYPGLTADCHYEIELVVALGSGGRDIPAEEAVSRIFGYAVGLDMTRRDLQDEAKKLSRPWDAAKAFEGSAPVGTVLPAVDLPQPATGLISLEVNGEQKQRGDLSEMIWPVPDIISQLSQLFRLEPGDLIFTGTPAGVGPIVRGDRMVGSVENVGRLELGVY